MMKGAFSPLCAVSPFLHFLGRQKPYLHGNYNSLLTGALSAPLSQPSSLPLLCLALPLGTCWAPWCCGSSWTSGGLALVSIAQVAQVLNTLCGTEGHSGMEGDKNHQSCDP